MQKSLLQSIEVLDPLVDSTAFYKSLYIPRIIQPPQLVLQDLNNLLISQISGINTVLKLLQKF